MSWSRILGSATLLAFVLSLGVGSVESAIPNPTNKKFYACMKKRTGTVRLINYPKKSTCAKGWKLINWNAKGNEGPAGVGYEYPHDYEGGDVEQQYLPDKLKERRYYDPTREGWEARIADRLDELRAERQRQRRG